MTQEGGKVVQFPGQEVSKETAPEGVETQAVTEDAGRYQGPPPVQEAVKEDVSGNEEVPVHTSGFSQVVGETATEAPKTYEAKPDEPKIPEKAEAPKTPEWVAKKGCFQYRKPEDVVRDAAKLRIAFMENGSVMMGMECHGAGMDHAVLITAAADQYSQRPVLRMLAPIYDELMAVDGDQLMNYQVSAKSISRIYPLTKFDHADLLFNAYIHQVIEMWAKRVTHEQLVQEAKIAEHAQAQAQAQYRQQLKQQQDSLPPEILKEQLEAAIKNLKGAEVKLDQLPATTDPNEGAKRNEIRGMITKQLEEITARLEEVKARMAKAAEAAAELAALDAAEDQATEPAVDEPAEPGAEVPEAPAPGGGEEK